MKTTQEMEAEIHHWRRCVLGTFFVLEGFINKHKEEGTNAEIPQVVWDAVYALKNNPDNPMAYVYQPFYKLPQTTHE